MKFSKFSELMTRIWSNSLTQRRDPAITIIIHSPGGIGATPSVEVESIQAGFDWDAGQVLICPVQPLTTLTPEQVADITASVRRGQSWHAFEAYKKHKAQLENAAIENAKVAGQRDDLLAALVSLSAVARRYLPDYDEHPEVQKADAAIARIEVEVR
ncbi:hypothetical protein [Klebsiella michiganensis]|uniref:hypothetical protein n=1 Tax=Klebsiella michiganensis TaxID=1134687 RepID=UPI0015EAE8BA|nr:hypothetical protein [Klebsiella michiganensis]QMR54219.1 hypothetical protein HV264_04345 [Klebsiella michiganensis]